MTASFPVHVGVDVGSTTTKVVAIDPTTNKVLYSRYSRHRSLQAKSVAEALGLVAEALPNATFRVAFCGSGGKGLANALGVPFVQEVVANSLAIRKLHPEVRCAIEIGGQDAKMVFFRENGATGEVEVSDMRMNGSCAGGTGAFIDEIATLLRIPVEEFDAHAQLGGTVHSISGRCGVYAKTDIQPLLNQGIPKEDLALSTFHAIAKQTIGGLAQGTTINPPVIFEGGPLTFNPTLVQVFAQRLALSDEQVVVPSHPEIIVAFGAALSLDDLFADADAAIDVPAAQATLASPDLHFVDENEGVESAAPARPYFADEAERQAFYKRHDNLADPLRPCDWPAEKRPKEIRAYLGVDSGSTTTKLALVDEEGRVIDSHYSSNEGEPLDIVREALVSLRDRYRDAGIALNILGVGTTGYGELLFASALHADHHTVETVAHARATANYIDDASFILDIGGQDMKAIWLSHGVITDIVVNEACSSGCGSFLESFAATLGFTPDEIGEAAFRSKSPARLGSRCTVFMNSSIITEQRNGKTPDDIMAGLCRSIIENVFTKVVRIPNIERLGKKIVVQGGTFRNDAVLCALEQHLGCDVVRAPYPGIMGAIGVALLTQEAMAAREAEEGRPVQSSFVGLDGIDRLSYTQESPLTCPYCENHCARTKITFTDGSTFITGHRCSRGEIVGDPKDPAVRKRLKAATAAQRAVPNLFDVREKLLLAKYPYEQVSPEKNVTIGLPRVLSNWEFLPFWRTLLSSLGFKVRVSGHSTPKMYESGLAAVTSDTICFPAKLVHGHLRDLARAKVDRIFMPTVTTIPTENVAATSVSMCAVVKGYSIVVRNSDNPERVLGVPFDDPLFHWYTTHDRDEQLAGWFKSAWNIPAEQVKQALAWADEAQGSFREQLMEHGKAAIALAQAQGRYAVVMASRPYHNDPLVNHDIPKLFTELGLPVLTPDAVPGVREVDLSNARIDVVNNFHARMLGSAVLAAQSPDLEYVQLVSFGCGHDAYLSDEIVRLMDEVSGKAPLILKMDETPAQGSVRIRVRSFVETIDARRAAAAAQGTVPEVHPLADSYPVKYRKSDGTEKVILVPNTSHAFCQIMTAAIRKQGFRAEPLEIGRDEAIRLGKRYVHNDICFPAQIVIGEALAALESGQYDTNHVAIGTGKYIGDCRLTHYAALLRKALDDAGYANVPIMTNDDVDAHNIHPGFKMSVPSAARIAFALPMIDALEELLRKIRPYELVKGAANKAFEAAMDTLCKGLESSGIRGAKRGFKQAVELMRQVDYDRSNPRPRVLIVGEYLLNFHPGANHEIEAYLEDNGMEVIEARMTDVIRKTYFYKNAQVREFKVDLPAQEKAWYAIANQLFELAHNLTDRIAAGHPLYEPACRMPELVVDSDPIIHHSFDAGEGVLIPGEILHHAKHGCESFIILQPFGCLPNHVVGRGIVAKLRELHPDAQVLCLDYDPDVSFANIENRLQMLIMNALNRQRRARSGA